MVLRHVPLVKGMPQAVVEPPLTIDTWRQGEIIMPEWAAVDWFPHRSRLLIAYFHDIRLHTRTEVVGLSGIMSILNHRLYEEFCEREAP